MDIARELSIFVSTIIYAMLGMVLLFLGYRVFDWMTPGDSQKKIFEEGNLAVAVLIGSFILGLAIVILSAIHG
jgi:putative membrane protein